MLTPLSTDEYHAAGLKIQKDLHPITELQYWLHMGEKLMNLTVQPPLTKISRTNYLSLFLSWRACQKLITATNKMLIEEYLDIRAVGTGGSGRGYVTALRYTVGEPHVVIMQGEEMPTVEEADEAFLGVLEREAREYMKPGTRAPMIVTSSGRKVPEIPGGGGGG